MIRNTLFASLLALGAAATTGAQAFDHGAPFGGGGGGPDAVGAPRSDNVVGGGRVAIAGGGDNMRYQAALDARAQESDAVATLAGGGDNAQLVYRQSAPAVTRLADARRR